MNRPTYRAVLLTLPLALGLSGCISFGAKPPPSLLTLNPDSAVATDKVQSSTSARTITVSVPWAPQELATGRVPVHARGVAIAYIKDAQWVEPPSRLFARLLSDTVTVKTGRVVLSNRQSLMDPGARLTGELRSFGVDEATNQAVVVFDATLMRGEGAAFEKRRFEARASVSEIKPEPVGAALNEAANRVAAQVAEWVGP